MSRRLLAVAIVGIAAATVLGLVQLLTVGLARPTESAPATQTTPAHGAGERRPGAWPPARPPLDPSLASRLPDERLFTEVAPRPAPESPAYEQDEIIVRFKPGVGPSAQQEVHGALGGTEAYADSHAGAVTVSLPPGVDVQAALLAYERDARVEFAQPNYRYTTFGGLPTDPAYVDIQHWYYHAINAPAGWNIETGDDGIIVAVVDTGVDITHPDLDGQVWTNPGEIADNLVDDDNNGCVDDVHGCAFAGGLSFGNPADDIGHGTFVGGVACGEANNGVSGVGVAFNCTIMPVKVLTFGSGDSADIAAGIVYAAENGADVINMSLGFGCLPGGEPLVEDALQVAHDDYGTTIVVSSGNSSQGCVSFPASDPNAIAVSASGYLDDFDGKADFSQWGPEIAVTAPGINIVSALPPQVCGLIGDCLDDGRTAISSGTSFSAPQVSGLAALLLSQDGTRTNEDVRTIMQDTAHDLPDGATPNWDGAGRIDVTAALGGASIFAPVLVDHAFPPVLQLTVGAGNPASPACQAVVLDAPPILASRVSGTFGVSQCATSWPPSVATPWFLKGVDSDPFPDDGAITDFALQSSGLFCGAFDTPVPISDDDSDGAASIIECPSVPELDVRLSPPAKVALGESFDYELQLRNRGSVSAGPVIVENTLPPALAVGGPLPAGCSIAASTITCDAGTVDSGETTVVTLPAEGTAPGIVTNCATVDPDNTIAEADETNNTSCADTEVISLPPATFSNSDPPDDTFAGVPPDITEVRGSFDSDEFLLTVEFADSIVAGEVGGFIDFDTDQDSSTGLLSGADSNCLTLPNLPPGMEGADVFGDIFAGTLFLVDSVTFELIGVVPVIFSQDAVHMIIPIDALGGDSAFDFTMVLGTSAGLTDCAPNGTSLGCAAGDCEKLPPPPPPPNDNFIDASPIDEPLSPPVSIQQAMALATLEVDEPQPCGALHDTVWYTFTPSRDTVVAASATSTSSAGAGLAVYIGNTLNALEDIACSSSGSPFFGDPEEGVASSTFLAEAGLSHRIQVGTLVDPFGEATGGLLTLELQGTPAASCAPGGKPGDNNGFESGIPSTKLVPCWTSLDQTGSAGGWCVQSGTQLPAGDCSAGFSFGSAPIPPEGRHSIMTNSDAPGSHLLYRCGVLDAGTMAFRLFLHNDAFSFNPLVSLDYRRPGNQQFRADLVTEAGMAADPFTLRPEHILANLHVTDQFDPNPPGYVLVVANAAAFVGQNVCLRFAEVDSVGPLNAGVDDVRFFTRKEAFADTDQDGIANGSDPDDDNDGCTDTREAGASAVQGGQRNPHNPWDFLDVPTGAALQRNGSITAADVGSMVARFGATDSGAGAFDRSSDLFSVPDPAVAPSGSRDNYHPAYDRGGSIAGQQPWDLLPANGSITAADLAGVVAQFGHTCA
jgi:subtilisin family serine protease